MRLGKEVGFLAAMALAVSAAGQSVTKDYEFAFKGVKLIATATVESKGEGPNIALFRCEEVCKGKKHAKHEDCDDSCDIPCYKDRKHSYFGFLKELAELGEGDQPPKKPHKVGVGEVFEKFGMPTSAKPSAAMSHMEATALEAIKFEVTDIQKTCWNRKPCSSSTAFVNSIRFVVKIEYELVAFEGEKVVATSPKNTIRVAIAVPAPKKDQVITVSEPAVSCKCEVVQKVPDKTGFLPGYRNEDEYAFLEENGQRRTVTGREIGSMVTEISVQNMNRAVFTVAPGMGKCFIPAGWELESLTGEVQNVQLQEDLWIEAMPWPQRVQAFLAPITLRTLCLEIDKPEPSPAHKFRFVPPSTPALARLARGVRESSFRGPWDQARAWIATDYSTYEEIRQVMLPAPSKRTYLYEMHSAAKALAFAPDDKRADAVMELALLVEPKNDHAAAAWMLRQKLAKNGKATMDWVKANGSNFHKLFTEADAVAYIAHLAASASEMQSEEAKMTAVHLLTLAVPNEKRAEVGETDGAVRVAYELVTTNSPKVADAILDWLEQVKPSYGPSMAKNISASLPENIKERAKKLVGEPWWAT